MTYKEAYENIKATLNDEGYRITDSVLETALEALEKQMPKKLINSSGIYLELRGNIYPLQCPSCKCGFKEDSKNYMFCPNCGQAIDWDASNEN